VSDYYPEGPTLYVIPGAWCDMSGAVADKSTHGLKPRASRRRGLLQASGPPAVSVNSGATCGMTGEDPVAYKVGSDAPQVAERVNGGAFKIALPNDMTDVRGRGAAAGGGAGGGARSRFGWRRARRGSQPAVRERAPRGSSAQQRPAPAVVRSTTVRSPDPSPRSPLLPPGRDLRGDLRDIRHQQAGDVPAL
jgi:hypothetical protein